MYSLKKQYGDFTITYIDSITYYNYLGAKADCLKKGVDYLPFNNERALHFSKFSSHNQRIIANKDFKYQLKNNPYNLFKAYLFCIYSNSSKGSYIVSECKNEKNTFYFDFFRFLFKAISKVQNIALTIFGIIISVHTIFKSKEEIYKIISLFILYIFFISAMSCYECDRFHVVFYPLVLLLLVKFISDKAKPFFAPLQK